MVNRKRHFSIEYRAADDGRGVSGTAIVYNSETQLPWGKEKIMPGALEWDDEKMLLNLQHSRQKPLARGGKDGTLKLMDSDKELRFSAEIVKTTWGDDCMELLENRIIRGASIEFSVESSDFSEKTEIIKKAKLYGIGLVDIPQYEDAFVEKMRSFHREKAAPTAPRKIWEGWRFSE